MKRQASRGSAAAVVAEGLRSEILSGLYRPGERLGEAALAQRFGVSRGPVREALRSLAKSGLITFTPNVGARVREVSAHEMQHLHELREALEIPAAALAAQRIDDSGVRELRALLAEHAKAVLADPSGAYLQGGGDADFHLFVARQSGNPQILRLLSQDLYPQLILLRRQHRHVEGRGIAALHEHERIAEAIAAHDGELAAMLMQRHLRNSWASLQSQIPALPVGAGRVPSVGLCSWTTLENNTKSGTSRAEP